MAVRFDEGRKVWFVDVTWRFADQKTKRRVREDSPINTKEGAKKYELEVKKSLQAGTYKQEVKVVPKFKDYSKTFMETYAAKENKPSEIAGKRSKLDHHLLPAFGELYLDRISLKSIDEFAAGMKAKGKSVKTINNCLTTLNTMFKIAQRWGHIAAAPAITKLKATDTVEDDTIEFFTQDDARKLVDACVNPSVQAAVILALNTGLRLGELRGLRWMDVSLDAAKPQIVVRNAFWQSTEGTPKGRKAKPVPLNAVAVAALKAQKARASVSGVASIYVFSTKNGKSWSKRRLYTAIRRACVRAGLPWARCVHKLRHSFASHLAMANVPLMTIKELMRHSDIKMTMRYAHLSPAYRNAAVNVLDAIYAAAPEKPQGNTEAMTTEAVSQAGSENVVLLRS